MGDLQQIFLRLPAQRVPHRPDQRRPDDEGRPRLRQEAPAGRLRKRDGFGGSYGGAAEAGGYCGRDGEEGAVGDREKEGAQSIRLPSLSSGAEALDGEQKNPTTSKSYGKRKRDSDLDRPLPTKEEEVEEREEVDLEFYEMTDEHVRASSPSAPDSMLRPSL